LNPFANIIKRKTEKTAMAVKRVAKTGGDAFI